MNWKRYQEEAAQFFRSLGCEASVEKKIAGVRAEHEVDVWVCFKKFGVNTKWVIECKYWNSSVTKEKVLVLRSVVEDVGADRGIMISAAGYQSGAVRAAGNTNITLTDLDGLRETARDDLTASAVQRIAAKAVELKYALHDLLSKEQTGPSSWELKPIAGIDSNVVINTIGKLSVLEFGFDRVRIQKPPYPIKFDEGTHQQIVANTLDEFVVRASDVIGEAQSILDLQLRGT